MLEGVASEEELGENIASESSFQLVSFYFFYALIVELLYRIVHKNVDTPGFVNDCLNHTFSLIVEAEISKGSDDICFFKSQN